MKTSIKQIYLKIVFIFLVIIIIVSCTKEDDEFALNNSDGISPNSIIHFKEINPQNTEADGVSYSTISVQINPQADPAYRQISLNTTLGKFSNGRKTDTIVANANGVAYFTVSSEVPDRARITATVKSYSINTNIDFRPALPDDLLIDANHYVIDNTQTVTINANLLRDSFRGEVSDPIKVFYKITSITPQPNALVYPDFGMSSQGMSNITISNPFHLLGDFRVEVKTLSSSNDTLRKSLAFRIQ